MFCLELRRYVQDAYMLMILSPYLNSDALSPDVVDFFCSLHLGIHKFFTDSNSLFVQVESERNHSLNAERVRVTP